ncbi:hypothetical protein EDB81DRAFT_878295 [Dactylonectria macrodidyma]|uniref:NADH2 dehydrogenase 14K chain n=1 Tax=Dactylonectria macrodidyma TaxID=307937 RepID=A0A9P9JJY1_9HYPO|nr:hypothetical protein EDB81DRAFT_878295 [Dactylonectria macrodidyma]
MGIFKITTSILGSVASSQSPRPRIPTKPRDIDPSLYSRQIDGQLPNMVHRLAFWGLFGLGVRFWQVGIEMRPFFNRSSLWAYPVYAAGGASFGYWLQGVDDRQTATLTERKAYLLEKRARKAQRDAEAAE